MANRFDCAEGFLPFMLLALPLGQLLLIAIGIILHIPYWLVLGIIWMLS